jgi:hypothetical protein
LKFGEPPLANEIAMFMAITPITVMAMARTFLALLLIVPPGGSNFVCVLFLDLEELVDGSWEPGRFALWK